MVMRISRPPTLLIWKKKRKNCQSFHVLSAVRFFNIPMFEHRLTVLTCFIEENKSISSCLHSYFVHTFLLIFKNPAPVIQKRYGRSPFCLVDGQFDWLSDVNKLFAVMPNRRLCIKYFRYSSVNNPGYMNALPHSIEAP